MKTKRPFLVLASTAVAGLSVNASADEKWLPVQTLLPSTIISGYVDTSLMWRIGESRGAGATAAFPNTLRSPGRLYDVPAKNNGFNLNVVSIGLDRPLGDERWAAGYHVQMLIGPDATLRGTDTLAGTGGAVFNEAYVALRAPLGNGLNFRIGLFSAPLGYEVFDSFRNPNYSRSYGFFIEPKAHTGITVSYDFCECFNALAGVANTISPPLDSRAGFASSKTYLALFTFTAPQSWGFASGAKLTAGYTGGNTSTAAPTDTSPRIHNFYAGLRVPTPLDGLTAGLSLDYQANAAANQPASFFLPAGPKKTYANAFALYLDYAIQKWQLNTRAEYASGTAANTIFASRDAFGSTKPLNGPNNVELFGLTETIDYRLWANVVTRVEGRWDRDLSGGVPVFGTTASVRRNSLTLTASFVYQF